MENIARCYTKTNVWITAKSSTKMRETMTRTDYS